MHLPVFLCQVGVREKVLSVAWTSPHVSLNVCVIDICQNTFAAVRLMLLNWRNGWT